MKFIVTSKLWFCFALLLPSIIQGEYGETIKVLNSIIAKGGKINNVFIPLKNGFLGGGECGFVYKGIWTETSETIAMKFFSTRSDAEYEFMVYSALGAYNEIKNIEDYGVPKVYYKDKWLGLTVMGITLLDTGIVLKKNSTRLDDGDILILFREVVRITKYMHSRGICHRELNMKNIMFLSNQGFIIDYRHSTNARGFPGFGRMCRRDDWKSFLSFLCKEQFGIEITWSANLTNKYESIKHAGLKRVILEFSKTTFTYKDGELDYDNVYGTIDDEIKKYFNGSGPALLSWLTPAQRRKAKSIRIPRIDSISFQ